MPVTAVSIPCAGITLEGLLHLPDGDGPAPAVVVCHPHPRYGGDMHNNVVAAAVSGLTERGIAALRFNFRGTGSSGGQHSGGAEEIADVRAALTFLGSRPEIDGSRLGLAGYSFGAAMALRAAGETPPAALALISLPLTMAADAGAALAGIVSPVLLLAGDSDHVCPLDELEALAEEAGAHITLAAAENTDHFWWGRDRWLADAIGAFFAEHLLQR